MSDSPPGACDGDAEDLVWALTTADALWVSGRYDQAVNWVRRAAELAQEAGRHQRSVELAKAVSGLIAERNRIEACCDPSGSHEPALAASLDLKDDAPQSAGSCTQARPPLASLDEAALIEDLMHPQADVLRCPRIVPRVSRRDLVRDSVLNLELSHAFDDVPADTRQSMARAASVMTLSRYESFTAAGLALVLSGTVGIRASGQREPLITLGMGRVIFSRGTLDESASICVTGADTKARLAHWSDAAITTFLFHCPWTLDDLKAVGDELQTLVTASSGDFLRTMHPDTRRALLARMSTRVLLPQESLMHPGDPPWGLMIMGLGLLEVLEDRRVADVIGPGHIVFANDETHPIRASRLGATVLIASGEALQQLMIDHPDLRASLGH